RGHASTVQGVCFSPHGTRLASVGGAVGFMMNLGEVKVWDSRSGDELLGFTRPTRMSAVCFSPDGTRLATAGLDQAVRIWETLPVPPDALRKRALTEKGNELLSRLLLKDLVLRELRMDPLLSKSDRRFVLQEARKLAENYWQLNDTAWRVVRAGGGKKEAY